MEAQQLRELATPKNESRNHLPLGVDMDKVNKRNKKYYVEEREIQRNERKVIQITTDGLRWYRKDQVIRPSIAYADELIAQKTGKEISLKKGEWVKNGKIVKAQSKKQKKG